MASLYILILMTPTAKLFLSLQQVPQPHLSLEKRHSTPNYAAAPLGNQGCRREGWRKRGGQKRYRGRVRVSHLSQISIFESLSSSETQFDISPPPLEKEIDFCLEFVRSGNQKQDNGTPHGERLRGAISNQSARGLTNPSIVPPQPPAAHQHIHPHCPPPSCSGICSPQQPVLSEAVRAEVSHWQFAPNRFVRASNCTTPTCGLLGLGSGSRFLMGGDSSTLRPWGVSAHVGQQRWRRWRNVPEDDVESAWSSLEPACYCCSLG